MAALKPEDQPTWEDMVRVRRANLKLSAEVVVLKEEIKELEQTQGDYADMQQALEDAKKKVSAQRTENKHLSEKLALVKADVVRLENENGALESRLARAMGRTIVIGKNDEIAMLVATMVRLKEVCEAKVGKIGPRPFGGIGPSIGQELEAAFRMIRNELERALREHGVSEKEMTNEERAKAKAEL